MALTVEVRRLLRPPDSRAFPSCERSTPALDEQGSHDRSFASPPYYRLRQLIQDKCGDVVPPDASAATD